MLSCVLHGGWLELHGSVPYTTASIYHTPLGRFSMLDISTAVGIVSVPKEIGVGNISPRAFRRRIVRYWHPLGCRAIELGKPPQGVCDVTAAYGNGTPGTVVDVTPNLPKCLILILMYRTCRFFRYCTGVDVAPNLPKCSVPV